MSPQFGQGIPISCKTDKALSLGRVNGLSHSMNPRKTLPAKSARPRARWFSVFALFCYVVSSGIVPSGFMAAPLESGTAFHLCPGDARSAVVISKLMGGHEHHHHHHHEQSSDAGEVSAETGCAFTGQSSVAILDARAPSLDTRLRESLAVQGAISVSYSYAWARPPVRSPPA